MDRLESLGSQLSQISMYDIKSMYEQAKNVVLNVSECEAKVREATNDDPWGASSTLMQDIANRTFNYADFNEIMPAIYSRFMEKEARQWRQIYKALQLLEYLIKHGSERVVDDARSHISTVKMLRNFHFIDDGGKDQGINVRNRSKELVDLLADVERIRIERKKAKANKHKYTGTGNDGYGGSVDFSSGGSSRYGGFGAESFNDHYASGGGGSSGYSGGGGGGGGGNSGGFRDSTTRGGFDEYDAGGDDLTSSSPPATSLPRRKPEAIMSSSHRKKEESKPQPKQPEVDLFGGFDDPVPSTSAPHAGGLLDDDFADFQEAPSSPPAQVPSTVASPTAAPNAALMGLFNAQPLQATTTASPVSSMGMAGMGMGSGIHQQPAQQRQHQQQNSISGGVGMGMGGGMGMMQASKQATAPKAGAGLAQPASKPGSSFDDLWSMGLGSAPSAAKGTTHQKSMMEMQKEKSNVGLWGGGAAQPPKGFNDSMFGGDMSAGSGGGGGDSLI